MIANVPWAGKTIPIELLQIRPPANGKPAMFLYAEAAHQFVQMDKAARAAGIQIVVNTAFRDSAYQQRLYDQYLADKAAGRNPAIVARPGSSDHERGLSIDINTGIPEQHRNASKATKAGLSATYRWMHENAHKWGFENDVASEPWHWTYETSTMKAVKTGAKGIVGLVVLIGAGWVWFNRRG